MREILFRGQTRRKGEKVFVGTGKPVDSNWVYGGVFQGEGDFSIIYSYKPIEKHTVYTDTVGQFIGLTDKNGKKVFEGDIVGYVNSNNKLVIDGFVKYGQFNCSCCDGVYGWYIEGGDIRFFEEPNDFYEVIGNIHDNPELLEVKE